jgi:pimeloyl-ACP methyl ester carboxylesterase
METVTIDGVQIEYEVAGTGEPAVLIHGALIADSFRPLCREPSLLQDYELVLYHRRGYSGSGHRGAPVSIARLAADCRALLGHLGIDRAHVVGESLGGCIAIQLALDAPDTVHTLALLEPALAIGESGPSYRESLVAARQQFHEGPAEDAVDGVLRARMGPGYRARLDRALPGWFDQAVIDASTSFELELPAWLRWAFGEDEANRIRCPVLAVTGSESAALWARFDEAHQLLLRWLPDAESFVLPGATHGLHLDNPRGMAEALASFWARAPLQAAPRG